MAFYNIFESLCAEKGVTPTQVARDNEIKQSVVAMWKKRGSTPNGKTLTKLSSYFGVSTDYLLGKEEEPFKVGDSFIGNRLQVTKVVNNGNGTFDVSFAINHDGMTADELKQVWETLGRMSKESGVPIADIAQFTESINKAIQSTMAKEIAEARYRAETAPQSTPAPQEGKDTTPLPDVAETPPEGGIGGAKFRIPLPQI